MSQKESALTLNEENFERDGLGYGYRRYVATRIPVEFVEEGVSQ